jgi:hypothetical protein
LKSMTLWLVVLGMALAGAGAQETKAPQPAPASLKDSLLAKEKALEEAEKNKDATPIQQQVADDFVGVDTDGQTIDRDEILERFNEITLQEYTIYDVEVRPLGDAAAVLSYDAIVRITGGDSVIPRYQRVSSVWVNQGGMWKLKFRQATAKKWGD